MDASKIEIGDIPASLRARLEISQEELAERAGVSRPTVAAIESGEEGASLRVLRKVARALQVPAVDLFSAWERACARREAS